MAVFLLKTVLGSSYTPPPATGTSSPTCPRAPSPRPGSRSSGPRDRGGLRTGKYCPDDIVSRAQMAAFLVATFNLQ